MDIILTPEKYANIKHFSDLRISSLEIFTTNIVSQKGLQRRKNLKEALEKLIKVSFAYSKMGYKEIGVSSSTFQKLLACSKQTVFNFLRDIKKHFSHIITVEKKLDKTGRFRNFFKVNTQTIQQLSDILSEQEHKEIEKILEELNLKVSINETLEKIKKDKNLTNKELKKEIKHLLKKKEQFKNYLLQLFQKELSFEKIKETLEAKGANNPDFINAVYKLIQKGHNIKSAVEMAKIKYSPVV